MAVTPIDACVGIDAIKAVPAAINRLVTFKPAFRPLRSARLPITIAPSGRIAKPMPTTVASITFFDCLKVTGQSPDSR